MSGRRTFIKTTSASLAAVGISSIFPGVAARPAGPALLPEKPKLRFALASDGHFGQPGTDYKSTHSNIITWLNEEHDRHPLDLVIFNGDLVHDRPELLKVVAADYLSHLKMPYYAVPGNHDLATTAQWKACFGYEDNFSFDRNGVAFVLANTSNVKGEYICPDNRFIQQQLERYQENNTVFVVLHVPPHQWTPEQNYFAECPDTLALLHRYKNVKAVFHGHDHLLDTVLYTGVGLPHFFDAHYGGSWGTEYYGYRVVEVSEQNRINTYQVNASRSPVLNSATLK